MMIWKLSMAGSPRKSAAREQKVFQQFAGYIANNYVLIIE